MIDLSHRHVLVIGGTGTIGSAIVMRALERSAAVTATASSPDRFDHSSPAEWISLDVRSGVAVDTAVGAVPGLTDIVLAAAARPFAGLVDMDDDDLRSLVDTKLWGAFHVGRAAARHLPDDGSLTFISGLLAGYPDAAAPVAAVSAAVEALGRGLAVELAPRRVNIVSPDSLGSPGRGRHHGTASDVADLILGCITNEWLSGTVLEIHGAGKP